MTTLTTSDDDQLKLLFIIKFQADPSVLVTHTKKYRDDSLRFLVCVTRNEKEIIGR